MLTARRGVRRVSAGLLLVLVSAMLPASPASAATGSTIVGRASNRCLDVNGVSKADGAQIILYDCNGQANQAWTYTAAGELRVYDGAKCLDVDRQVVTSPAVVQLYTCNGQTNQKWKLNPNGTITGVQSGLCLDATDNKTANFTRVRMFTCNSSTSQQWTTPLANTDKQPPSIPANPRVSNLTCNSVNFAWNAATDNVGVAFYDVYHDGQLITTVSGSTLSANLTVLPGTKWGLYVNARDAAGNVSQASTTVPITPPQCQNDTQPPTAPTNLAASVNGTTVTLTWTAATDNIGVRYYDVYRNGAKVGTVSGSATTAPGTSYVDSGLAASTTFSYTVVARDASNNASGNSNTASATTGSSCGTAICSVTEITTDTDIPWGLVTLPDNSILYARRNTHNIIRLDPATGAKTDIGTVPNVENTDGEGGLLGLAISPSFATDQWLYIMHTSPTDNRIVRIKYVNGALNNSTEQVLLAGILRNKFHDGGRLRFGPDGKLYATAGDAQNGDNAQNLNNLNGKILRINPDGTIPSDNPFGNAIWSYGHRNPQGLAFDSKGRLWEQEFGNSTQDETNLIVKGGNYGWPACEGTAGACNNPNYIAPKQTYPTNVASCSGIAIVRDVIYIGCQAGARLNRVVISGDSLTNLQSFLVGTYGRIRTVEPAPGGNIWVTTTNGNGADKILRVTLGS